MSIEAWVTDPAGTYLAHLDRSEASPFRHFRVSRPLNGAGHGSLEYHLDNELVASFPDLFAFGNLIWMRYRGRTMVWIVEERQSVLDEGEHLTDWVVVGGRGARQLLGDRIIWPTEFDEDHTDPRLWGVGGWSTKTDATAAVGQNVVPVASTAAASIGIPVQITGGGHSQLGIVESIVAGVSVTVRDPLAYTFPVGSRVVGATSQWRRFVNRAAGEMLWDLIDESNPRFATQLVRGTIETTGADGWTQDFRFDNLLEVVDAVCDLYGDVDMDGLTFNYRNVLGSDRTDAVILEEGADLVRLTFEENDRDTISWVVAEGTGEAVFAKLKPKAKPKRRTRKTPALRLKPHRRRAPEAPKKVEYQRVEFPIFAAEEEEDVRRRREAYLDAKDVSTEALLDEFNRAALEEHAIADSIGVQFVETRYQAGVDFDLGDWIRVVSPSRGTDEDVRIVALHLTETDDELVRADGEFNTAREEWLGQLDKGNRDTRSSLGVRNRQPQGQLVPFSFSGQGVFDQDDTLEVHLFIPDRMYITLEARAAIDFRPFFAPAKSAASGGGSTSGASSSSSSGASSDSTTGEEGSHDHGFAFVGAAGGFTVRRFAGRDGAGNSNDVDLPTEQADSLWTTVNENHLHGMAHTHGIAHTHSTPNHTHGLTYGVYKEAYPASHSVTLKVYELEAGTWTLRGTIPGLVADQEDLDLSTYITGPGQWLLELVSAAAQPNGGRLGAYVSGYVLGAIQSA
ncbi:MAG: hypothetical protein AB1627_01100 [Chloroflexota bacterium]